MIQIRQGGRRGHADHGWLDTYHSFSFAEYYDAAEMGWGALRVLNEDRVQPGRGFAPHAHRDMEIVSYVLSGALQHRDSLGNGAVIRPDEVQRMSAGRGVRHSEFNASSDEPVHFLQIWIEPRTEGIEPAYEQKHFAPAERRHRWRLIASGEGREGSVTIHQNADVYAALLDAGDRLSHGLAAGRLAYVHLIRGCVHLNGQALKAGDGARIAVAPNLVVEAHEDSELLLFDLPPARTG